MPESCCWSWHHLWFLSGLTDSDHRKLRHIKAQPCRPSSSPCRLGEGPGAISDGSEKAFGEREGEKKRMWQSDRTRGREGVLSDLGTWWKGMLMLSTLISCAATAKPPFAPCDINTLKTSFVSAVVSLIKIWPKSLVLICAITLSRLSRRADSVAFSLLKWPGSGVQSAPLYYVI